MSKRTPELFIQDMLEAIEKIERYTSSIEDLEDFTRKDIVVDVVLRNLET
ncbi:MAG: ribonuclease HepT family protein [Methanoculleaceae archaeon]